MRRLSGNGVGGTSIKPRNVKTPAGNTGTVYTIRRALGAGSVLSLASGSHANLSLNASTGAIAVATAIPAGTSQTANVHEANGNLSLGYPVIFTGVGTEEPEEPEPVDPPTPVETTISAIAANGWQALTETPVDLSFEEIPVTRAGFDDAGNQVARNDTLLLTKRVRQAYPNQASFTADKVALSDYVYSTDTIAGVTNSSTEASPKPIAAWVMPDRLLVGNSVAWEIVAFHRNARAGRQVACVQVRATDGTNTTAWQTVSSTGISTLCEDVNPIEVYSGSLDISALATGLVTLQGRVLPWVGGVASILDSSEQTAYRQFSPRYFLKNTTRHAAPPLAYVSSVGDDDIGSWSTDAATAEATPFLTIGGAMMAVDHATRGTPATDGVMDGCRIRLMDAITAGSTTTTRPQNVASLVIEPAPGVSRAQAVLTMASNFRARLGVTGLTSPLAEGAVLFKGVTIERVGTPTMMGESAVMLHTYMQDCIFAGDSGSNFRANAHASMFGVTFIGTPPSLGLSGAMEYRILRGVTCTIQSGGVEGNLLIGSTITNNGSFAYATPDQQVIIYNNKFPSPNSSNGIGRINGAVSGADYGPIAFVQNLIETTHTNAGTMGLGIANDGANGNLVHAVVMHNTFTGYSSAGRTNVFYDDHATVLRNHKLIREVGNIHSQLNTKGDVFKADGTRLGQFAYTHGVGVNANFLQFLPNSLQAHSEVQSFKGVGTVDAPSNTVRNDPLFVDYKGTTGSSSTTFTAGAGGGDYRLQAASPAKDIVTDPVLRFDLVGQPRPTSNDSAGAYQTA